MDRRYLSPFELLCIATQHARAADLLLQQGIRQDFKPEAIGLQALSPIISLMYQAFELLFKAYALHEHRLIKGYKNLGELIELNRHLGLSSQEIHLLKLLSKHYAFHKGIDYDLCEDLQQVHIFCEHIISLYERVQKIMPVELMHDFLT